MTVGAFWDKRLIEMGIDPAEFSEPERVFLFERISEEVNKMILELSVGRATLKVICEQDQREYQLLENGTVQRIDAVSINGSDITRCRVANTRTFSNENRS